MLFILKKIAYVLAVVLLNTYICAYLGAKLSARMELRRGYRLTRIGGIGFPAVRALSCLSKGSAAGFWSYMVFIFSIIIWGVVPFTAELILMDMGANLLVALILLLITVALNVTGAEGTGYGIVEGRIIRKTVSVLSLTIPYYISIASLVLAGRTLNLKEMVDFQRDYWNIVYQPLGFVTAIFSVIMILKVLGLNREGKQGLSGINRREGPGPAVAFFRFSGYSVVLFMTYLITILYLGGYKNLYFVRGDVMLGIKFYVLFIFILFAEKALGSSMTEAGILMRVSGKFLIPMSIINLAITLGFFIYRNIYGFI